MTPLPQARDNLRQTEKWLREALEGYLEEPSREARSHLESMATEYHSAFLEMKDAEEAEYLTT